MARTSFKVGLRARGPISPGANKSSNQSTESCSAPTTLPITAAAWDELQSRADLLLPLAREKNPEVTARLMARYRAEVEVLACLPLEDNSSGMTSSCGFVAADAYLKCHDPKSYHAIQQQTLSQLAALVHNTWPDRVDHYLKIFPDVLDSDSITEVIHDMVIWRIQNAVPDVFGDNWFDDEVRE